MPRERDHLLPLLLNIEQDLEQDLSLGALASRFGASEFHFHRKFTEALGETPKQHVERLRLEKAALDLAVTDMPVTELAFTLGFRNLETFSRRFKAAFGHSPSAYRKFARGAQAERVRSRNFHESEDYYLSRASFVTIPDMHLLAMRQLGDYGALIASFGDETSAWSEVRALAGTLAGESEPVFVGIFLDDPTQTPEAQRRADVCVLLRAEAPLNGKARCLAFQGGLYACAQYIGTIAHMLQAYQGLADDVRRSGRYTFRSTVALLFPRARNVGGRNGVNSYEVCFPIARL